MAIVSLDRIAIPMCGQRIFLILLLLLASIAMAETRLKLNFPDEFYYKQPDSRFDRGAQPQNEPEAKARQWHEHADESSNKRRWNGVEFRHLKHTEPHPDTIPDSYDRFSAPQIKLEPQLELRF